MESPLWSYQLGLQGGWITSDPRKAVGVCGPPAGPTFSAFQPWMTGGAGAGQIAAAQTQPYPYPPVTLENPPVAATLLPSYTSTGSVSTLPPPTYTNTKGATISAGDGWFDAQDTLSAPTPIAGCNYPNPWGSQNVATLPPAVACGGAAAGGVVAPVPTTAAPVPVPVAVTTTVPAVARTTRTTAAVVNTATAVV